MGYENDLPIAEINNSVTNGYYFNSFENSDGNSTLNDCKTGRKAGQEDLSGSNSIAKWHLCPDMVVKIGNTWSFNTIPVSVTTGSYTISLTGQVDDVRLYLKSSTMKTYTYDPQ